MSTVRQCFEIDYSHCLIIYKTIQAKHKDNGTEHHEARLYLDFAANCKFASIYLSTVCLLYTSPSPRDRQKSRMPSSA